MIRLEDGLETVWRSFATLLERRDTDRYPPFFFDYCRDLVDKGQFQKKVWNVRYLFQLSRRTIEGSNILDAGCGFGIDCVLMAAMGASEVHGVDANPSWIKTIQAYLDELEWSYPIVLKTGDAVQLPCPDDFFDVVLSVEAISHYRDVEAFIRESHRVLRKGGVLVISDNNNGANPFIRRKTYKVWERFEKGPPADCFLGHPIKQSYLGMRREIIASRFPQLNEKEREVLAENTFGMGEDEVVVACERYVEEGILPQSRFRRGVPPFNPVVNEYIERLFRPKDLTQKLRANGFRAKMFAHFGGAGAKNLVSGLNAFLRFFTFVTVYGARGFKIVGVKR